MKYPTAPRQGTRDKGIIIDEKTDDVPGQDFDDGDFDDRCFDNGDFDGGDF